MECAFNAGVFQRAYVTRGPLNMSTRATSTDKAAFTNWMSYLKVNAEEVLRTMNNPPARSCSVAAGDFIADCASVERVAEYSAADHPLLVPLTLNSQQALAYDIVSNHLEATKSGIRPPQLRLILRGPGGTGKTVVINAITESFR